jgi:PIN domain nuclease of toxin-antitoxin system
VRLLLDTHVYLWFLTDARRLSHRARRTIAEAEDVYVSSVCVWEVAIKFALRKLDYDPEALAQEIEANGFHELPVHARHAVLVARLPLHHGDPFDRIMVAQALCEPLTLLTADPIMQKYLPNALLI